MSRRSSIAAIPLLALLLFLPAVRLEALRVSATAQTGQGPATPPAMYLGAVAFDSDRGCLVMFGGFNRGRYSGDTWEWDGVKWTLASTTGPAARNSPAMAYDSARKRMVLFGGDNRTAGFFRDTWEWDGKEWKQVASSGPPARTIPRLAYDRKRKKVVLFGGTGETLLGDTWEWDGTQWSQVNTSGPAPRILPGLAYDAVHERIVLFGGNPKPGPDSAPLGDTWEWDGTQWKQSATSGPSARDHVTMAFDAVRKRVVLFGGGGKPDEGLRDDTWEWDGTSWSQRPATGISPRAGHQVLFDSRNKRIIVYGGFQASGPVAELWALEGDQWRRIF